MGLQKAAYPRFWCLRTQSNISSQVKTEAEPIS